MRIEVRSIDEEFEDLNKARVKPFIRTRRGHLERVKEFTRNVPEGSAVKVANALASHFNVKHFSHGSNPYSNIQQRHLSVKAKNEDEREKKLTNLRALLEESGYKKFEDPYKVRGESYKKGDSEIFIVHEPAEKFVGGKPGEHVIRITTTGSKKAKRSTLPYYD